MHERPHLAADQYLFKLEDEPRPVEQRVTISELRQLVDAGKVELFPYQLEALHQIENYRVYEESRQRMKDLPEQIGKMLSRFGEVVPSRKPRELPRVVTGRNDPCTCGSGKKFKKCCINKEKR